MWVRSTLGEFQQLCTQLSTVQKAVQDEGAETGTEARQLDCKPPALRGGVETRFTFHPQH